MPFVARGGLGANLDRGNRASGELDPNVRSPAGLQERFFEEQDGLVGRKPSRIVVNG